MNTLFSVRHTAVMVKLVILTTLFLLFFRVQVGQTEGGDRNLSSEKSSSSMGIGINAEASGISSGDEEYIIGIGDIIAVQVWREPELTSKLAVRTDGRISLPLVGDVEVAGKSINSLTNYLSREFSKVINEPAVSVTLVENRSKRYYLVGQIQNPGEFSIDQPITLIQAIARGGGFLEWARRDRISIIRRTAGREERIKFDYDAFVREKNRKGGNILIFPGDTIIVP
jgi:polysaccharide biosynthesis/export protein